MARPPIGANEVAWPPTRRSGDDGATTGPSPRGNAAAAARQELDDDPPSRATFERAKLNPLVAESLRERKKDPVYFKVIAIGGVVLVLGFFGFTWVEPYLPGRGDAQPASVVSMGGKGYVSVIGRTGDHVTLRDHLRGETIFSISLPFKRMEVPAGSYRVSVEGPFDGVRVEGDLVVERNGTAIFDAIKAANEKNRNPPEIPNP